MLNLVTLKPYHYVTHQQALSAVEVCKNQNPNPVDLLAGGEFGDYILNLVFTNTLITGGSCKIRDTVAVKSLS
jgi:hypothetical protein